MMKELIALAKGTFLTADSEDEYTARRRALGMKDDNPLSSCEVAIALGVPKARWQSPNWRTFKETLDPAYMKMIESFRGTDSGACTGAPSR